MKTLSILGSTGSIGTQTLDIVQQFPDQFNIHALTANSNITLLKEQILTFSPKVISVSTTTAQDELNLWAKQNNLTLTIYTNKKGLLEISSQKVDLLIVAIAGTSGIAPTYAALKHNIPIALACKEVLVSAGDIIMNLAKQNNTPIIPIDSEHAAIHQCLTGINFNNSLIKTLTITASGGPFWDMPITDFQNITPQIALKHPNWAMGKKISIDSATMVNKGLEIIEAHHLFNIDYSKIKAVIHRQSIIHALLETIDGNILAHLSPTDMRFPIQYALTYPNKLPTKQPSLDLNTLTTLSFNPPDNTRFPLLNIAITAGKKKGTYPVVFNAANEAAVELFLTNKISFLDIEKTISSTLETFNHSTKCTIEEILQIDENIKHELLQIT